LPRNARKLPRVDNGKMTVDAAESIVINLGSNNLDARRDVKTLSQGDPAPRQASDDDGIFNRHDKLSGAGAELHYDSARDEAHYIGTATAPASLRQGDTVVSGIDLKSLNATQDLNATGQVESTFVLVDESAAPPAAAAGSSAATPPVSPSTASTKGAATKGDALRPAPAKTTTYRVSADTLAYLDAARTATYIGKPARMRSADGETTAPTLILTLAGKGRTLDRLEAKGGFHLTNTEDREALGESMVYEAATDRYTLKGTPLRLRSVDKENPGKCALAIGSEAWFTGKGGTPTWPERAGGSQTKPNQPCTPLASN
jgi:lipopolysaccharide export system protein LptA